MLNQSFGNVGVYVIHALKGYEYQEKRVVELFQKNGLQFEFVTDGDPSLFNNETIEKYFVPNINSELSKGVLSCTLNHIYAYERMVAEGVRYAMIFENDPFFLGNFIGNLKKCFDEMEYLQKGFIISLENSTLRFPSFWQVKKGKFLYKAKAGRMAGAYIIDLVGAARILNDLKINKCHTVIDWWHNSLAEREIVNIYWAHPPLVEQGSHNGLLGGTISTKPKSIKRRIKWLVQKVYKYYVVRLINDKRVIE
jgi:glycosyl transferase family 25